MSLFSLDVLVVHRADVGFSGCHINIYIKWLMVMYNAILNFYLSFLCFSIVHGLQWTAKPIFMNLSHFTHVLFQFIKQNNHIKPLYCFSFYRIQFVSFRFGSVQFGSVGLGILSHLATVRIVCILFFVKCVLDSLTNMR